MIRIKGKFILLCLLAAVLIALPLLSSCGFFGQARRDPNSEVKAFSSYKEFTDYVNSYKERTGWFGGGIRGDVALDSNDAAPESAAGGAKDGDSQTNTQVAGVDEGDIVKIYDDRIFTLHYNYNGNSSIAVLDTAGGSVLTIECKDYYPTEFYVESGRLVVFGTYYEQGENWGKYSTAEGLACDCIWYMGSFVTKIYDISELDITDPDSVTLARTIKIPNSYYQTSRRIGNTVHMALTSYNLYRTNGDVFVPEYYDTNAGNAAIKIDPTQIYLTPHGGYFGFMYLVSFDITEDEKKADFGAYLGYSSTFYSDEDSFYAAANVYYYDYATQETRDDAVSTGDAAVSVEDYADRYRTYVLRFDIKDGKLVYDSYTYVKGYIRDQFSMDEYDNSFRIVATQYVTGGQWQQSTYLYVFDIKPGKMEQIGKSAAMGVGETLFSVRFNGTICRVVTAVQRDPLYLVDLTDKRNPKVSEGLKSEGVNDYMHDLGAGLTLGLGRAGTETGGFTGFKASVYYTAAADTLKELLTYADKDSYSELSYNHKALLVFDYADDTMLFGIPLSGYRYYVDQFQKYHYVYTSKLIILKLSTDAQDYDLEAQEIGKLPADVITYSFENGDDWYYVDGIRRAVVVNGELYAVGNTKIIKYNIETLEQIAVYKL